MITDTVYLLHSYMSGIFFLLESLTISYMVPEVNSIMWFIRSHTFMLFIWRFNLFPYVNHLQQRIYFYNITAISYITNIFVRKGRKKVLPNSANGLCFVEFWYLSWLITTLSLPKVPPMEHTQFNKKSRIEASPVLLSPFLTFKSAHF